MMKTIRTSDSRFDDLFNGIMNRGGATDEALQHSVERIVADVAARGDEALFEYTRTFDGYDLTTLTVAVTEKEMADALSRVEERDLQMIRLAAERIERFHRRQIQEDWMDESEGGVRLGQRLVPLERAGIYVPGGLAAYPSTVLMAAIPARIAGVEEIVIVSPLREGTVHPLVAAAAHLSGVSRLFKIGGAQAIAALAYGTASIPRVDKIVGPGNAYVAAAKKLVYGQVAIDMIAGPSEILVIADGKTPASFVAADLLAQAEHDEMASAVLLTPDESYARAVSAEVFRQVEQLKRKAIAVRSLNRYGAAIVTKDMSEAVTLANRFAPEHLELAVSDPDELLPLIRHAGAIFMGSYTPETLGDYLAGPNHILPTSGTARFSSALGVYDFVKRISVLSFSPGSFRKYGRDAARFADLEGLEGHGNAIRVRL
ncbi:MAG: Histidinol dehydrogenase [Syntrophus sp. SKADARSKE-3]|nr:Histidinol dehydrogenase [Syntrophus sp. SKADARSKE-3]